MGATVTDDNRFRAALLQLASLWPSMKLDDITIAGFAKAVEGENVIDVEHAAKAFLAKADKWPPTPGQFRRTVVASRLIRQEWKDAKQKAEAAREAWHALAPSEEWPGERPALPAKEDERD